jgi:hypothetical protein
MFVTMFILNVLMQLLLVYRRFDQTLVFGKPLLYHWSNAHSPFCIGYF